MMYLQYVFGCSIHSSYIYFAELAAEHSQIFHVY